MVGWGPGPLPDARLTLWVRLSLPEWANATCHRQTHPVVLWAVVTGEPPVTSSLVTWHLVLPLLPTGSLTLSLSCSSRLCPCYLFLLTFTGDNLFYKEQPGAEGQWKVQSLVHPSSNPSISTSVFSLCVFLQLFDCSHWCAWWMRPLVNVLWKPIHLPGGWLGWNKGSGLCNSSFAGVEWTCRIWLCRMVEVEMGREEWKEPIAPAPQLPPLVLSKMGAVKIRCLRYEQSFCF